MGPTIAAIAGAIHEALGVRPRRLPFTPDNLALAMEMFTPEQQEELQSLRELLGERGPRRGGKHGRR